VLGRLTFAHAVRDTEESLSSAIRVLLDIETAAIQPAAMTYAILCNHEGHRSWKGDAATIT
jgi:hypothetical protein